MTPDLLEEGERRLQRRREKGRPLFSRVSA